ncbi:MAG: UvrD-helicase domain-containing protein, partial [Desulfobaccales bacterium]
MPKNFKGVPTGYHSLSPSSPVQPPIDYKRELNPAQYQAVTTLDGPVLVIAGAGSGKTRTLVYRLAYLVEQGVDPGAILLLTFTRKAAQEMLSRAVRLLDRPLAQVTG